MKLRGQVRYQVKEPVPIKWTGIGIGDYKGQPMNEEVIVKKTRRRYDEAFRREAVLLVESSGQPLNEIAAQLGITHWNLRDWIPIYGKRSTPAQLEARIQRLEQENARLRDQRDALKKAMGILAEPSGNASR